ncbi:carboxypeptidase-like regulatory domain-containing protein, partial [Myroides injenensis]|uniref:carboxypeptidase-like regulatory domain-containing protein n=1 Tax=Myroides injenensis TaxID=1183151 RepID=UPI000289BD90
MKSKLNWTLMVILTLFTQLGFAQEKNLSGVVTDEGFPMPGVSVVLVGTSEGTQTDMDGKYSLKVKTGDVVLFSFIGYKEYYV